MSVFSALGLWVDLASTAWLGGQATLTGLASAALLGAKLLETLTMLVTADRVVDVVEVVVDMVVVGEVVAGEGEVVVEVVAEIEERDVAPLDSLTAIGEVVVVVEERDVATLDSWTGPTVGANRAANDLTGTALHTGAITRTAFPFGWPWHHPVGSSSGVSAPDAAEEGTREGAIDTEASAVVASFAVFFSISLRSWRFLARRKLREFPGL